MQTLNELIDIAKDEMVLAIGRGDFKNTLDAFLRSAHSIGYNHAKTELTKAENKKYLKFRRKKKK